jgi:hypothetical protein
MSQATITSTVFYVSPLPSGEWGVFGPSVSPPLFAFTTRGDAMQRAAREAEQVVLSEVQVLGWNGAVEEYLVRPSVVERRPGCRRAITPS